ncbi:hypothetical protein CLOHYLEM_05042 [[Clostridium] hylemonae DSM 15053]|uniref:Uncharacterized protein n=1 Tax=[Clostridium] hylemonae DSM 15053 TaxID=553973 RepID=C0BZ03_9FIRM|nr:hypothetical protein CLOHYLEM_05042 [[Clostridium] hylemonae DSM 15053]
MFSIKYKQGLQSIKYYILRISQKKRLTHTQRDSVPYSYGRAQDIRRQNSALLPLLSMIRG